MAAIYSVPLDADWNDERLWKLANPNLGVSVGMEFLRAQHRKALESPAAAISFRRLHLNQWLGGSSAPFIAAEAWDTCRAELKLEDFAGQVCCAGLDLGSTRDLTALVLIFPGPDGTFSIVPRFFMPADTLKEHIQSDKKPYDIWRDQGHITLTPGGTIDYRFIRKTIEADFAKYELKDLAYDSWAANTITQELNLTLGEESDRPDDEQLKLWPFPQDIKNLSEPSKDLRELVKAGKIRHDGNPLMRWMFDCCTVREDENKNIKPIKPKKSHGKRIDGVIALVMGLARAKHHKMNLDFNKGDSIYETEDMLVL